MWDLVFYLQKYHGEYISFLPCFYRWSISVSWMYGHVMSSDFYLVTLRSETFSVGQIGKCLASIGAGWIWVVGFVSLELLTDASWIGPNLSNKLFIGNNLCGSAFCARSWSISVESSCSGPKSLQQVLRVLVA